MVGLDNAGKTSTVADLTGGVLKIRLETFHYCSCVHMNSCTLCVQSMLL